MDNTGDSFCTTGQLSTRRCPMLKLLWMSPVLCACHPTGFEGPQTRASIRKNRFVHRKRGALLLLLFIYRDIGEQQKPARPRRCARTTRPSVHAAIQTGSAWVCRLASPNTAALERAGDPPKGALRCWRDRMPGVLCGEQPVLYIRKARQRDRPLAKTTTQRGAAEGCKEAGQLNAWGLQVDAVVQGAQLKRYPFRWRSGAAPARMSNRVEGPCLFGFLTVSSHGHRFF